MGHRRKCGTNGPGVPTKPEHGPGVPRLEMRHQQRRCSGPGVPMKPEHPGVPRASIDGLVAPTKLGHQSILGTSGSTDLGRTTGQSLREDRPSPLHWCGRDASNITISIFTHVERCYFPGDIVETRMLIGNTFLSKKNHRFQIFVQ